MLGPTSNLDRVAGNRGILKRLTKLRLIVPGGSGEVKKSRLSPAVYNPPPSGRDATKSHGLIEAHGGEATDGGIVRVTGGMARGRRLEGPRGIRIRPTSDRVREALFDILGPRVRGCRFLDAYAGTGAVGVEALSRGARHVVFIERNRRALELIEANLSLGPWKDRNEVVPSDVAIAIPRLARCGTRFSIAFLDPPYDDREAGVVPSLGEILLPGGILVIEHRTGAIPAAPETRFRPGRSYRYGDTTLTVLHRGDARRRS